MEAGATRGVARLANRLDLHGLLVVPVVVLTGCAPAVNARNAPIQSREIAVIDRGLNVAMGQSEVQGAVRTGHLGGLAVSSGRNEVVCKQHDPARLRQRNKALKRPATWEAGVLVVCADKVPAGLVCNGLRDLRGGHPGFS